MHDRGIQVLQICTLHLSYSKWRPLWQSYRNQCTEAAGLLHYRACRPMSCTRADTSPSAVSRARAQCCPTSTSARAAGGGRCAAVDFPSYSQTSTPNAPLPNRACHPQDVLTLSPLAGLLCGCPDCSCLLPSKGMILGQLWLLT